MTRYRLSGGQGTGRREESGGGAGAGGGGGEGKGSSYPSSRMGWIFPLTMVWLTLPWNVLPSNGDQPALVRSVLRLTVQGKSRKMVSDPTNPFSIFPWRVGR